MKQEISEKIPVISFAMMCVVLLYHCESPDNMLAVNSADLWWNQLITDIITGPISMLCMCWFFTLSGFLLFRNLSYRNLGQKLKSRFWTLFVPYILWQIIYIVKSMLQGNTWTLNKMFAQIFLLRLWPPLGAFWYVYTIILLALLSPVFLLLFKNEKIGWISSVALILLLYIFWSRLYIGNGKYHYTGNIKTFFPSYVIGAFFGHIDSNSTGLNKIKYAVGFLLVAVLLNGCINQLLFKMTVSVLPVLMLFLLPVPEWCKNRKLYRLTFLIYATHQSIISLSITRIRGLIFAVIPFVSVANILGRILCILLIVAVNAGIHAVMSRFAPRTLKLLTGGRC